MFTFHWSELLVVVIGGLVLFLGLALLAVRRRNEVLQDFLTPEDPHLGEEFFRARKVQIEETSQQEVAESDTVEAEESPETDAVRWGAPANGDA